MVTKEIFNKFDIEIFSNKYLNAKISDNYYKEDLKENGKRTRSDSKISCQNMIMFILLWVLNPEEGYLSVLNKVKPLLMKFTSDKMKIIKSITDAGLCKGRRRFSSQIIKRIWQEHIIKIRISEKTERLWKGLKVCVVDGTTFTLNKTKEIIKTYPLMQGAKLPKMLGCILYDIYNKIPMDIVFGKFPGDERELLLKLIEGIVGKNYLLVLDGGYPAYWLFWKLKDLGIKFVIRLPSYFKYERIKRLGKNDWIIEMKIQRNRRSWLKYITEEEYKNIPMRITMRLIKTKMRGYRERYLVTSLEDEKEYKYEEIAQIYCDRWIIENYYRDLKHIFKVERFHAKYVDGIYQEIYSAMILTIVLQEYMLEASTIYGVPFEEISFKRAFIILKDFICLIELFPGISIMMELMLNLIAINRQKKRPFRHYKRIFYRKIKCSDSKWK